MSLAGVQNILEQAETNVTDREIDENIELETEDQSAETWEHMAESEGEQRPVVESEMDLEGLEGMIQRLSVEVAMGTDACYRRYMRNFDTWLQNNKYLPAGVSIFQDSLHEKTPLFIVAWIMSQCDEINPDGSTRAKEDGPNTYTHAMKLRSSLTYGFGRHYKRGNTGWHFDVTSQEWEGNPSVSVQVSRYMVSLRKRKFAGGDKHAMSSRAITSDIIREIYTYNQAEGRCEILEYHGPTPRAEKSWGSPRKRLLVHAVMTIAFVCLMRIDEVLNLRFEDIKIQSNGCITITLESRKTHQYGDTKPYFLWEFSESDRALCPVTALAAWIEASGLKSATGYIFRPPAGDRAPSEFINVPITSSAYLELFRNNMLDINIDPTMYGGHSFRRGGCQWLVRELRWPIPRVCDWGGWSKDFNHSSIFKYLFSWNDDPQEAREDFFNPNRTARKFCFQCGRSCWC